eukprot:scaffold22138_cov59-Phaeocystis_antarctica.AAC.1
MQMRVPYKKLITEFADNFFSDAVLCTMSESIKTLDRNDKYAKEKDVFHDTKYRTHLTDEKKALDVIKKAMQKKKKADATAAEGSGSAAAVATARAAAAEGSGSVMATTMAEDALGSAVATATAEEGSAVATATASASVATEAE